VLEWGAKGNAVSSASPQALALDVGSAAPLPYSGTVTTLAGNGNSYGYPQNGFADGAGAAAGFTYISGLASLQSGVIVVADGGNNRIRLVSPQGVVTTLAGSGSAAFADGTGAAASFSGPTDVAIIVSSSVIVVSDPGNNRIRLVSPLGSVTTLAGSGASTYADGAGTAASFNGPVSVAVMPSSNTVVVAETGRIRLVTYPGGIVTTIAGGGTSGFADGVGTAARLSPSGVAVVPSSNFIAVAEYGTNRIRFVSPTGMVTTIAGSGSGAFADGVGTAASFFTPTGVDVIPSTEVLVVADYSNSRIRLITPLGIVTTLAGSGGFAFADGVGAAASFSIPVSVAFVPTTGAIAVSDQNNCRVRLVSVPPVLPACDTKWHSVALIYAPFGSPYSLAGYMDGVVVFQRATTIALPPAISASLRVGWSGDFSANGGSIFVGALAELRIYNRTLAASEVLALSQPPRGTPSAVPSASASSSASVTTSASSTVSASPLSSASATFSATATASQTALATSSATATATLSMTATSTSTTAPCAAGFYALSGNCAPCSPGTYSLASSTVCSLCPAGTYGAVAGLGSPACSGACPGCPAGSVLPPTVSCVASDARAVPASLGLQLWPAAHPANPQHADLVIAPLALCQQMTSAAACAAAATVNGADGVTRYVVSTAAAFNMEADEALTCS
jgi:hypothetical protein